MTTIARHTIALALLLGSAVPLAAGQSANRTPSGPSTTPPPAVATVEESASVSKCRAHCGALNGSAPHQPHANVAEREAKARGCLREMAR